MILGEVQNLPRGIERENKIIQTILRQLLFALDGLHSTGIVHRDIKPQNIIFSEGSSHCPTCVGHRNRFFRVRELCFYSITAQVLARSRSLISGLQRICEWESTISQRSFFWTRGIFFSTTKSS